MVLYCFTENIKKQKENKQNIHASEELTLCLIQFSALKTVKQNFDAFVL